MVDEKVADDAYEVARNIALQYPNKKITDKAVAEQILSVNGLYFCNFIDKDVLLEIPAVVVQAAGMHQCSADVDAVRIPTAAELSHCHRNAQRLPMHFDGR